MSDRRAMRLMMRQRKLAEIARLEAMSGLASALQEQQRNATLAQRSAELATMYGARDPRGDAAALRDASVFRAALADMAREAQRAQDDARDQADWQAQSLAAAEHKARILDDRLRSQAQAIEQARQTRENASPAIKARKPVLARELHPECTDTPRTDSAFDDLEAHGSIARTKP